MRKGLENDNNKIRKNHSFLIWAALFVCAAVTCCAAIKGAVVGKLSDERLSKFNNGWSISDEAGEREISLPCQIEPNEAKGVCVSNKLPLSYSEGTLICIQTIHQTLRASFNGEEFYKGHENDEKYSDFSPGCFWQYIPITSSMQGKTIVLHFSSPYEQYQGYIPEIFIGTKAALITHIICSNTSYLIFALLLFVLGLTLFVQHLTYYKIQGADQTLLYLAMFSFACGLWLILYSGVLQLISSSHFLVVWGSYPLFIFLPMPITLFFDKAYDSRVKKPVEFLLFAFLMDLIIASALHFCGVVDYRTSLYVTHALIAFTIICYVGAAAVDLIKYKNEGAKKFLLITGILIVCTALELINFYTQWIKLILIFPVGLLLYITLFGSNTIRTFRDMQRRTVTAEYYKELAYHDILTKSRNRTAYTSDITLLSKEDVAKGLRIIMFDLNNLKMINDAFGHNCGDDALIKAFNCINYSFGTKGDCYRIGGDEFACILKNTDEDEFDKMLKQFCDIVAKVSEESTYPFSIAFGYSYYDGVGEINIDHMLSEADSQMYENKSQMKKNSWRNPQNVK